MTEWSQLDSKCFYCCGKKDATRMPTMFLQSKSIIYIQSIVI